MVFMIEGSGERTAVSFDGEPANAPILRISYVPGSLLLPEAAHSPSPAHAAVGIGSDPTLSWTAGADSEFFSVYFGTDPSPDQGELQGTQSTTAFAPGTLAQNTLYYWRVDAINTSGTTVGSVWQFHAQAPVTADTITIKKAEWRKKSQELKVEAKSSEQPGVTLNVQGFGQMGFRKGQYELKIKPVSNPGSITVTSNLGGSASMAVEVK
jgi:hypothetical protein